MTLFKCGTVEFLSNSGTRLNTKSVPNIHILLRKFISSVAFNLLWIEVAGYIYS